MTEYKQKYKEYIASDEWRKKRKEIFKKRPPRCEKCGTFLVEKYHVHHLTYKNLGNEKDEDLLILCEKCHMEIHHREKSKSDEVILKNSLLISEGFINLSNSAKIMFIYMKMWAGDKKSFLYSFSLARRIFASNTTISKNIKELENKKFIKIQKTSAGNLYTLLK